jgi:hypothetical protein
MKDVTIDIARTIGGGICVAADDGHKVYSKIVDVIKSGDRAILNFENVTRLTTAFLNAAVGQLYNDFTEDEVRKFMGPPINSDKKHLTRLKSVVDNAKMYFKVPNRARTTFNSAAGIEDDDDN